ncbi:MAG: hypothetical protein ACYTBJ_14435 [Planctomycetota bacterium]
MRCKKQRGRHWLFWLIVVILLVSLPLPIGLRCYKNPHHDGHIEVYDLTWTDKTADGHEVLRKWRYFIESKTNLPRKIEKYSKRDPNDKYVLEETLIVTYPTDERLRHVIKDAAP